MSGNERIPSKSNELRGSRAVKWARHERICVAFLAVKPLSRMINGSFFRPEIYGPVLPSRRCPEGISLKVPLITIARANRAKVVCRNGRSTGGSRPWSLVRYTPRPDRPVRVPQIPRSVSGRRDRPGQRCLLHRGPASPTSGFMALRAFWPGGLGGRLTWALRGVGPRVCNLVDADSACRIRRVGGMF
jgi:hypothetical protein